MKRNKPTIVSALFNIQREGMDGRSWKNYLIWFDVFLKLKCNMVLFVTKDLEMFIKERRDLSSTHIIVEREDEIPYYYLQNDIYKIINSEFYKKNMKDINRIECRFPMYSIIQFSKFIWLKKTIRINPFNSNFYFWIDAGGSKLFRKFNFKKKFPSDKSIEILEDLGETFLVQMNCDFYPDLYKSSYLSLDYLFDNRSFVLGGLFGGHKNIVDRIAYLVDDILLNKMISKGNINNEQIALGYLIKKYPEYFSLYCRIDKSPMDIFNFLTIK